MYVYGRTIDNIKNELNEVKISETTIFSKN